MNESEYYAWLVHQHRGSILDLIRLNIRRGAKSPAEAVIGAYCQRYVQMVREHV